MKDVLQRTKVEVVIPVYNPPPDWEASCLEHIIALQAMHPQYKFHFTLVNDGSIGNVLRPIQKGFEKSKIPYNSFNLSRNYGKGKALRTGVDGAKRYADFFICVDWDFPFGVVVVGDILRKLEDGVEVVTVDRGNDYLQKLPFIRSFLTRMWRIGIKKVLKLDLEDTQAGLKGFRKSALKRFTNCEIDSFLLDVEFILSCKSHHVKMASVPATLRGGVKLDEFSLLIYAKEFGALLHTLYKYFLNQKYVHSQE